MADRDVPVPGAPAAQVRPRFRGEAQLTELSTLATPPVRVAMVRFPVNAATHWHSHAGGQVLHIASGECAYQERDGNLRRVPAGETILAAPGIEHWHGAAGTSPMSHLAISSGTTSWGGAPPEVADDE
jgi:quercetin dioxygenase-like cupin family protein